MISEGLEIGLPTINKGKRLAKIDDDNYEEDFEDNNKRRKVSVN
jgi:hypothetical protein